MRSVRAIGLLRTVVGLAAVLSALVGMFSLRVPSARADSFSWSSPIALDTTGGPGQPLVGVACPSASQCTALDGVGGALTAGRELTFNPSAPASATPIVVDSGMTFSYGWDTAEFATGVTTSLACPSVSQCTAVDFAGREVTFNPTAPGSRTPISIDHIGLGPVACPSVSQCTAVDYSGVEVTFDPTAPAPPTRGTVDPPQFCGEHCLPQPAGIVAVACPSVSQCTAVDSRGREVTFNPTAPSGPTPSAVDTSGISAVACPSVSQCTAVDGIGREVTFDPTAPGSPTPSSIDPVGLGTVACPSPGQCTGVDTAGREVTFNPAAPGNPSPITVDSQGPVTAMACPSVSQCTAVDVNGGVVTFDPNPPGSATRVTIDGSGYSLRAVACPSVSQCTAVDDGGREVTFDPGAPGNPAPTPIDTCPPGSGCAALKWSYLLDALACPSVSQCTAVDTVGQEVTFNPSAPGKPAPVMVDGRSPMTAVACPTASQCTAVDTSGREVTFNPAAPGNPSPIPIDSNDAVIALACPSASQCTAIDVDGREVTFKPAAPGNPSAIPVGQGSVTALACPSAAQCTAVGDGIRNPHEVTFNPTAPSSPTTTTIDDANSYPRTVACPSVLQCTTSYLSGQDDQWGFFHSQSAILDLSGREVTFNPIVAGVAAPRVIAGANSFEPGGGITSGGPLVACPSVRECVAVDDAGNAFVGFAPASTKAPARTRPPAISGTALQGKKLTARRAAWANNPTTYGYQWEDCDSRGNRCTPIFAASRQTYRLQRSDAGHTIRVQQTATNAGGPSPPAPSPHTAVVSPLGKVRVGRVIVRGVSVRLPIRCTGSAKTMCEVTVRLTAIETIRGGRVIAVSAGATHASKTIRKAVVLSAVYATLRSGHRKALVLSLNARAQRLLAQRHRLRVKLTISQIGQSIFSRAITIRA